MGEELNISLESYSQIFKKTRKILARDSVQFIGEKLTELESTTSNCVL